MNKIWKFAFVMLLLMAIAGFVRAEENGTVDENVSDDAIAKNAIDVRYEHLKCKVEFTTTQIDLIDEYFGSNNDTALIEIINKLEDNKDTLNEEIVELADITEKKDFDEYAVKTLRPDMIETNQNLFDFKEYYKDHEFDNETKTEFRQGLKDAVQTYSDCVSDKENKMNQLVLKHNKNTKNKWLKIIEKMEKKNITISNLSDIKDEYTELIDNLQEAIDSGDKEKVKEAITALKDANLYLWAKFETSRFNGYLERLGPMAEKYNQGQQMKLIREKLNDVKPFMEKGYKYTEKDREKISNVLHDSKEELKNMTKDMLKERLKERQDNKNNNGKGPGRG